MSERVTGKTEQHLSGSQVFQWYGIQLGRLWLRWPYLNFRDLWIGVFVKPRYREGGNKRQTVYICPLPCVVLEFTWTVAP